MTNARRAAAAVGPDDVIRYSEWTAGEAMRRASEGEGRSWITLAAMGWVVKRVLVVPLEDGWPGDAPLPPTSDAAEVPSA